MKIAILMGSPKGNMSITMQYILYIQKKFPQHEYKFLNIATQIKILEKNEERFNAVIEEIRSSEGVIWGFPAYLFLVPSQYKRFIELIYERKVEDAFKDKYATVVCSSFHFFDHTAINYINAISDDLEMKFIGYFSATRMDLMEKDKREHLISFAEDFFNSIENNLSTSRRFPPLKFREFKYTPSGLINDKEKIDINGKKISIFTDSTDENSNLGKMIKTFQKCFSSKVEVININDVAIKGGCLGCVQCGYDNQCVYKDKDEYTEFFNTKLKTPDIIIRALTIKDRYFSSRWKLILDRSFLRGHAPINVGKQFGYIISGPLGQISNLRQIVHAMTEMEDNNLVDIITDEYGNSGDIDLMLYSLAKRMIKFSNSNYISPGTYLAVGGQKIFRDLTYRLRFIFQADHRYYEEHGLYDYPHDDEQAEKTNEMFIPLINNDEKFRKKFYDQATEQAVKPLQDIVKNPKK